MTQLTNRQQELLKKFDTFMQNKDLGFFEQLLTIAEHFKNVTTIEKKGDKGDTGLQGKPGPTGRAIKGDKGDVGPRGPMGEMGPQGRSIKGDKGDTGTAGQDAPNHTAESIRDLLIKLRGKQRLPASAIDGLEQFLQENMLPPGPGFMGIETQVRAGDNIEVHRDGTGAFVITGQAGGGSTPTSNTFVVREVPTGSINGSNANFTLAHTPAAGTEEIYLNGVLQDEGAGNDYTMSSNVVMFNTAPGVGDKILACYQYTTQTTANNISTRETPSGTVDGANVTFVLAHTPAAGTEEIFLNGVLQDVGGSNDYTISGGTITFNVAPGVGDKVRVSYQY